MEAAGWALCDLIVATIIACLSAASDGGAVSVPLVAQCDAVGEAPRALPTARLQPARRLRPSGRRRTRKTEFAAIRLPLNRLP